MYIVKNMVVVRKILNLLRNYRFNDMFHGVNDVHEFLYKNSSLLNIVPVKNMAAMGILVSTKTCLNQNIICVQNSTWILRWVIHAQVSITHKKAETYFCYND